MTRIVYETSPAPPRTGLPALAPQHGMRAAGIDVRPIPRAVTSAPEELRRMVAERAGPMLFPGLIAHWPACRRWHPETLRRDHGDKQVTALMDLPGSGVLFPKDQESYERRLSFSGFLDAMLRARPDAPCYLAYKRAREIFGERDYDFSTLIPEDGNGTDTRAWIGSAGTRSMLHSDLKDNLFCQIWGEKNVVLLPWRDSKAAYPFTDNLVNSTLDLAAPDPDRFPRLRTVTFYSAVMQPGDVLFIPRGCWHDIRALSPSISLNHWFGPSRGLADYVRLLATLGPAHWWRTAQDLLLHGLLQRKEKTLFFFSPPPTGKRLYDALRWGNFSRTNDPSSEES